MSKRTDPLFGITRIDQERGKKKPSGETHCWQVRLGYRQNVPAVVGTFNDVEYGGVKPALIAAMEYRDRNLHQVQEG